MLLEHAKYAWRIAFVGFNTRGDPQYYILGKKEALKENPTMEYEIAGNPTTQIGVL
jgi:hypothetical protein